MTVLPDRGLLDLIGFAASCANLVVLAWLGVLRWTSIASVEDLLDRLGL